jgi:hypothetical protein
VNPVISCASTAHTHFSMVKEGTFENATQKELQAALNGSFGGRFEYFMETFPGSKCGTFKFIAYTD